MTAGVYLHIPFCKSRCSYCDFATDVYRSSGAVDRYVAALSKEIDVFRVAIRSGNMNGLPAIRAQGSLANVCLSARSCVSIDTIYFGGGTPSLLSAKQVERILASVHAVFEVSSDAEITMEMNPATVTPGTLRGYKGLGINRASFGAQTFNDRALRLLARGHDANDARETFKMLREAGFDNVSFDLIAGLPNQTLKDWGKNLAEAIKLSPEHLSLYLLEIHEGTPLAEQVRSGRQPRPDEDLAAQMYEMMLDELDAAGFQQYEISNFSRPGFESRHNSKYWRLEPVFGFGVSAHSFDGCQRYSNERDTAKYIDRIEKTGSAEVTREQIDAASEFAFLGLRTENGIRLSEFERRYGFDLTEKFKSELGRFKDADLVETQDDWLRLTRKGKLFSNEVFAAFV